MEYSDDDLPRFRDEVPFLLGRCLLRLQQYERLLKAILADHRISGPVHSLEAIREKRIADNAGKTLGALVGDLLGSYVRGERIDSPKEATTHSCEDFISVEMGCSVQLPDAEFSRIKNELKEFVALRNNLVHHFIDQYDLESLEGCRSGHEALRAAYDRIEQHDQELRTWAKEMFELRQYVADFLRSDQGREFFVNGLAPDGTVFWQMAGIVSALRRATGELAVNGWTSLDEARKWIAECEPEQKPEKYGCRSWQQIVQESREFELRHFKVDGQRTAWYRKRMTAENAH